MPAPLITLNLAGLTEIDFLQEAAPRSRLLPWSIISENPTPPSLGLWLPGTIAETCSGQIVARDFTVRKRRELGDCYLEMAESLAPHMFANALFLGGKLFHLKDH